MDARTDRIAMTKMCYIAVPAVMHKNQKVTVTATFYVSTVTDLICHCCSVEKFVSMTNACEMSGQ